MKLELILLGLLKKEPLHGYRIKEIIQSEIATFTNVNITSIYYTLEKLRKQGYLRRQIGRQGNRPERYIYSITPEGERYFRKLLLRNLLAIERPFFNLDLGLYFLEGTDAFNQRQVVKILQRRLKLLENALKWAKDIEAAINKGETELSSRSFIPEHLKTLLQAEIKFVQELKEKLASI